MIKKIVQIIKKTLKNLQLIQENRLIHKILLIKICKVKVNIKDKEKKKKK